MIRIKHFNGFPEAAIVFKKITKDLHRNYPLPRSAQDKHSCQPVVEHNDSYYTLALARTWKVSLLMIHFGFHLQINHVVGFAVYRRFVRGRRSFRLGFGRRVHSRTECSRS
jgi:hypothetical protein